MSTDRAAPGMARRPGWGEVSPCLASAPATVSGSLERIGTDGDTNVTEAPGGHSAPTSYLGDRPQVKSPQPSPTFVPTQPSLDTLQWAAPRTLPAGRGQGLTQAHPAAALHAPLQALTFQEVEGLSSSL